MTSPLTLPKSASLKKAPYVKLDTGARPLFNLGESIAESWTYKRLSYFFKNIVLRL